MKERQCSWVQDGEDSDLWLTACDHVFHLNEGPPEEWGMRFCCFCGKELVQEQWDDIPF